jgi:hypothetical protein
MSIKKGYQMKINKTMLLVAFSSLIVPLSVEPSMAMMDRAEPSVGEQTSYDSIQEAPIYAQGDELMNLAKEVQENLNAVIAARKALNLTPTQLAPFKSAIVDLYENNASLKNLVNKAREIINNQSKSKSQYTAQDHRLNDQVRKALGVILDANGEARLYYATSAPNRSGFSVANQNQLSNNTINMGMDSTRIASLQKAKRN